MEKSEPTVEELTDSVIRAGIGWGYGIGREQSGRLRITAVCDSRLDAPLTLQFTGQELREYYSRLAAKTGTSSGESTPWKTWTVLMSTHLSEAVYKAGILGGSCVIVIDGGGFWAEPCSGRGC